MNLSPKLDVSADFVRNGNCKDSCVVRDGSHQRLGGTGDKPWCRECAPRLSKGTPKDGTHLPAVCATSGQLDHFAALALQQLGEQPALRKGRRMFCHNVVFHVQGTKWFPGPRLLGP